MVFIVCWRAQMISTPQHRHDDTLNLIGEINKTANPTNVPPITFAGFKVGAIQSYSVTSDDCKDSTITIWTGYSHSRPLGESGLLGGWILRNMKVPD